MSDIRYFERFSFSVDDPNKWFRILPLGDFQRFGRDVSIGADEIADMAANFRAGVPETGTPVTTAHKPEAGKVGDIAEVEARDDGLYARIDWLGSGLKLIQEGAFQFFSPEILWGEMEHEGRKVKNILMGLSLVNDPFFGKATALFSLLDRVGEYREFSPEQRRQMADEGKAMPDGSFPIMTAQDLQNAISAWGRAANQAAAKRHIIKRARALGRTDLLPADWAGSTQEGDHMEHSAVADVLKGVLESFGIKPQQPPAPIPVTETAEYKALADDRKKLADKLAEEEKARRVAGNVEKFSAALKTDKFEAPKGLAEKFAAVAEHDMTLADELAVEFKALVEQADKSKLFGEVGSQQGGGADRSPAEQFIALAKMRALEKGVSLADALKEITTEQPKLYEAYRKSSGRRSADDED